MVEESAVLKHRQVAPPAPPPKNDKDDEEMLVKETTIEEVQPKPGLIWRVGSGLWGASSVRGKAKM